MRWRAGAGGILGAFVAFSLARSAAPEPRTSASHVSAAAPASAPDAERREGARRRDEGLAAPAEASASWARALPRLHVVYDNDVDLATDVRLYDDDGTLDTREVAAFKRAVGGGPVSTRALQLVVKAAYHFAASRIEVVSASRGAGGRRRQGGPHGAGRAVDFKLPGVSARDVAAYLRTVPRAGVGLYTNSATQFVHVDVRSTSFHWSDASPPGRTWRERPIADPERDDRDARWTPEDDLPP